MGVIGKTDRVDARMLAELGDRLTPAQTPTLPPDRRALQAPATRRRQLVEMRKQEATRLQQTEDPVSRADIRGVIALLDRRIAKVETRMVGLASASLELAAIDRRLRSAPGVGPVVAATLIAELPELGQIDRRSIAALAGWRPSRATADGVPVLDLSAAGARSSGPSSISQHFKRRAARPSSFTSGSASKQPGNPSRPPSSPPPGSWLSPSMPCSLPVPIIAPQQVSNYSCRQSRSGSDRRFPSAWGSVGIQRSSLDKLSQLRSE